MAEILEKGLIIGFGLSVAIVVFTIGAPYISIILNGEDVSLNEHDSFVLVMKYGISYIPSHFGEIISINMSLSIEINLSLTVSNDHYALNVVSTFKSSIIESSKYLEIHNNSVSGVFTVIFRYFSNFTQVSYRGI